MFGVIAHAPKAPWTKTPDRIWLSNQSWLRLVDIKSSSTWGVASHSHRHIPWGQTGLRGKMCQAKWEEEGATRVSIVTSDGSAPSSCRCDFLISHEDTILDSMMIHRVRYLSRYLKAVSEEIEGAEGK